MDVNTQQQLRTAVRIWEVLQRRKEGEIIELDGQGLNIADVAAVAHYGCVPKISDSKPVLQAMQDSVDVLARHLENGWYVYGVNTGFGGSADSRTSEVVALQSALMQLTQAGILNLSETRIETSCPNDRLSRTSSYAMPSPWAVVQLLGHHITPVVPLRGTVSASGDLMPLSYIAGAIEGNPDVYVESTSDGALLPAHTALQSRGLEPVRLGPKEGLGLVNGTASSAALGALVIHEAHNLSVLTQALTAMAVEALHGSAESFHPFIANVRPHEGQLECAKNILAFLRGSYLAREVREPKERRREDLIQDRYCLRSAPQWIGPQLEDLMLADRQIHTELNSSCDNPLVDSASGSILYGCNFQAASVTSAMEKARLSLQMFGRLIFCQMTEMVDPSLSGGLPANLAADDPSLSFTMKGVDISMASYMAELSYLAQPMSSHVQAAEMHNQSVNSMAFASARMSMEASDILSLMCANSLYASCQALDLRVLHRTFVNQAQEILRAITSTHFASQLDPVQLNQLCELLHTQVAPCWYKTSKLDLKDRCEKLVQSLLPALLDTLAAATYEIATLTAWRNDAVAATWTAWNTLACNFSQSQDTERYLGAASKVLYRYVRQNLAVPFHRGFVEHPTFSNDSLDGRRKRTVGGWISIVHAAIKNGCLFDALLEHVKAEMDVTKNQASQRNSMLNGTHGGDMTHDVVDGTWAKL